MYYVLNALVERLERAGTVASLPGVRGPSPP